MPRFLRYYSSTQYTSFVEAVRDAESNGTPGCSQKLSASSSRQKIVCILGGTTMNGAASDSHVAKLPNAQEVLTDEATLP